MQITIFVGNGYDLSINLKTSYLQFIDSYILEESEDEEIITFKNDILKKNIENWSDAEKAFGEYIGAFKNKDILKKCLRDFELSLLEYLEKEDKTVEYDASYTVKSLSSSLSDFNNRLRKESCEAIDRLLSLRANQNTIYNFVNFNYTGAFEKAINLLGVNNAAFGKHKASNGIRKNLIGEIVHIHGRTDLEMIFGVDNVNQIYDDDYKVDPEIKKLMIKPDINKRLKTGNADKVKSLVNYSDIVIIYGMSIGDTDATWWSFICNWLNSDDNHQLVIFTYQKNYNSKLPMDYFDISENEENKVLKHANLDKKSIEKLRNRIHITINERLFPVKVLTESEKIGRKAIETKR